MISVEEHATIQYRITPSKETVPHHGDVLHACGLTNWHLVVCRIIKRFPPNEDGTMDIKMSVIRQAIGEENRPCPVCGAVWMVNASKDAEKLEHADDSGARGTL